MSHRLDGRDRVEIINLNERWQDCHACGGPSLAQWGLPVNNNGEVVANDWPGEWGGVPACERCWERHERGELVECPTSEYDPRYHGKGTNEKESYIGLDGRVH